MLFCETLIESNMQLHNFNLSANKFFQQTLQVEYAYKNRYFKSHYEADAVHKVPTVSCEQQ